MTVLSLARRRLRPDARPRPESEAGSPPRPARAPRDTDGRQASRPPRLPREAPPQAPAAEDRALYACACGFIFSEDVTTSVLCPHCGHTQPW